MCKRLIKPCIYATTLCNDKRDKIAQVVRQPSSHQTHPDFYFQEFANACGAITGDDITPHFVPSNGLTCHCEMRLAPDLFLISKLKEK